MDYSIETINKYIITCNGKRMGTQLYDEIKHVSFDEEKSYCVFKIKNENGMWSFYDAVQDISTCAIYTSLSDFYDLVAIVAEQEIYPMCKKYQLMNRDFQIISETYDYIKRLYKGLYLTSKNGKYGIINNSGEEILSCEYNFIENGLLVELFGKEFIALYNNEKQVLVDQDKNVTILNK